MCLKRFEQLAGCCDVVALSLVSVNQVGPTSTSHDGGGPRNLIHVKNWSAASFEVGGMPTDFAELIFYFAMAIAVISTTVAGWILLRSL